MSGEETDHLGEYGGLVLDPVRLVNYEVAPHQLGEGGLLTDSGLIRGDAYVEAGAEVKVLRLESGALVLVTWLGLGLGLGLGFGLG